MKRTFQGRAILAGETVGEALVSRGGFNIYASFFSSIHQASTEAICADSSNPDLVGKDLAGKIICLPGATGSTSSGAVWQRLARLGNPPKAMLFSRQIDSLAAGGLLVADIWAGRRIFTVDRLGDDFLAAVKEGDRLLIKADGSVTVLS